jgi:hypothetical protein
MDRENIRRMALKEHYVLSRKVQGKLDMGKITHGQIEQILMKGTETKREADERTSGEYEKITLVWKKCYLVVKNTDPCYIITAGRRD